MTSRMAHPGYEYPDLPDAACAAPGTDPEIFFPYTSDNTTREVARTLCQRCPEVRACLTWALTHQEHGIWAGTTETARQDLLARHRTEVPSP